MSSTYIYVALWWHPDLLTRQHASRPVPHVRAISGAVTVLSPSGVLWQMECTMTLTICFRSSESSDYAVLHSSRVLVARSSCIVGAQPGSTRHAG